MQYNVYSLQCTTMFTYNVIYNLNSEAIQRIHLSKVYILSSAIKPKILNYKLDRKNWVIFTTTSYNKTWRHLKFHERCGLPKRQSQIMQQWMLQEKITTVKKNLIAFISEWNAVDHIAVMSTSHFLESLKLLFKFL